MFSVNAIDILYMIISKTATKCIVRSLMHEWDSFMRQNNCDEMAWCKCFLILWNEEDVYSYVRCVDDWAAFDCYECILVANPAFSMHDELNTEYIINNFLLVAAAVMMVMRVDGTIGTRVPMIILNYFHNVGKSPIRAAVRSERSHFNQVYRWKNRLTTCFYVNQVCSNKVISYKICWSIHRHFIRPKRFTYSNKNQKRQKKNSDVFFCLVQRVAHLSLTLDSFVSQIKMNHIEPKQINLYIQMKTENHADHAYTKQSNESS